MTHAFALVLYVGAFIFWSRALWRGGRGGENQVAFGLAAAAVVFHGLALIFYTLDHGELPISGLGPFLSTAALVIGLALMATMVLGEASRVGIVLVPIIVILEGIALVLGVAPAAGPPLDFRGYWFALHVGLGIVGFGGMAVAFAAGLLYLVQFHELKDKHLGRLFRFIPPLATLDRLVKVGVGSGFVALSLAITLGWVWTVRFRGTLQMTDPEVWWGVFSWVVLLLALILRRGSGRRERRGAMAAVVGFAVVVAAYLLLRATSIQEGVFL